MQSVRVIPCLDVDRGRVVKGVEFAELRDAGDPVELAARYDAEGADERGEPIEVVDQLADSLLPIARSHHENPTAFIEINAVFGDLAQQPHFVQAYRWALDSLHHRGARATLEALLR